MTTTTDAPTTSTSDPAALVRAMFDAFLAGDAETPMATWRDDAVYTALAPPAGPATLTKQQYWSELLPGAIGAMPGYELQVEGVQAFGPIVVVHLRSSWRDGAGEGVMLFRVVEGEVAEVWALHADGRDATTYF